MIVVSLMVASVLACPTYLRSRVDTGIRNDPKAHCLYWKGGPIPWTQGSLGDTDTAGDTGFAAVSQSFRTWSDQSAVCGNFTLPELPRTFGRDIGYDPNSSDNQNVVLFRSTDCSAVTSSSDPCRSNLDCNNKFDCWQYGSRTIALTTTTYDRGTGQIYDADLELNDHDYTFTTTDAPPCSAENLSQFCVATDIENTVTHEVGHMLGLDHPVATPTCDQSESTMHATAPLGETKKRSLDDASKAFVCDVYPKGNPSRDCIIESVSQGNTAAGVANLGDPAGCSAVSGGSFAALGWLLLLRRRKS